MPKAFDDENMIRRAIELARRGMGHTRPNPPVGAVVVMNGVVIGEGWHRKAGTDHAEVAAIKDAIRRGNSTVGASIYVTLEPCSKPGRVGACTDAITASGISRVVFGAVDPNPTNRGRAKRVLAKAGISCERIHSKKYIWLCEDLIKAFRKHVLSGMPYVTVKLAMSLDGKICDNYGDAKWVSSPTARKELGRFRERVDAIMVGAGTIRADDPSLLSHGRRNDDLIRVVVTSSGRVPERAQVFTDGARNQTLVFRIGKDACDLKDMMFQLGKLGVMHVLCEGGLQLATSLAESGLVDEWESVLCPKVIGNGHIADACNIGSVHAYLDDGIMPYVPFGNI